MSSKNSKVTVKSVKTGNREGWKITRDGKTGTVYTSKSSARSLDRASRLYDETLKRLAKR